MKRPAMPLYVADWLADGWVRGLKPEERSVYIDLLLLSWQERGIDARQIDEQKTLARMCGVSRRLFGRIWSVIRVRFELESDSKYRNSRVEKERTRADKFAEEQRKRAQSYWDKKAAGLPLGSAEGEPSMYASVPLLSSPSEDPLSRAKEIGHQSWGAGRVSSLWFEVLKKTPTGNYQVLVEAADRIALSAKSRSSTTVETHAIRLLQSFASLVDGWRKAKRPTPQLSVEAFIKNFAACEEIIDGERDPEAMPVVGDGRKTEPPQREYEDLQDIMRRTAPRIP